MTKKWNKWDKEKPNSIHRQAMVEQAFFFAFYNLESEMYKRAGNVYLGYKT